MSNQSFLARIAAFICAEGLGNVICKYVYRTQLGFNDPELNIDLVPTISLQMPAGASSKQYIHFLQSTNTGKYFIYINTTVERLQLLLIFPRFLPK